MGDIFYQIYQIFSRPSYSPPSVELIKGLEEIYKKSIHIEEITESIKSILEPYSNYPISTTKNPRLTQGLERLTQNLEHAFYNLESTSKSIDSIPKVI